MINRMNNETIDVSCNKQRRTREISKKGNAKKRMTITEMK